MDQPPERACFVLGPHRSGATIVSQALAESGRFVFLSAADIVARLEGGDEGSAALARLEAARESRAIDEVAISTTVPEEYGFLLPERHLTEESAPRIAALHRELAAERGAEKGWLLRNPHDLSRVSRVERHFPGARYVFVVRDPARTINSQLQALRTLFATPSEYHALLDLRYRRIARRPVRFALVRFLVGRRRLVDRLLRSFVRQTDGWARDRSALPAGRWIVSRHEDLIASPAKELTRIFAFLELPRDGIPRLAARIRPDVRALDPHVERRLPEIRERTREYREDFGY